jgi:excinuclease UvrABC ATPase subunit
MKLSIILVNWNTKDLTCGALASVFAQTRGFDFEVIVVDYLEPLLTSKKNDSKSVTLDYLRGDKIIELPEKRRDEQKGSIQIRGGKVFNIKNLNVDIPLGRFICVTGVSGSGKSSFVYEILHKNHR